MGTLIKNWGVGGFRWWFLAGALIFFGQVGPSSAHHSPPQRELLLQVDDNGAVGVVRYSLTGNEVTALMTTYDLDRDGRLSEKEGAVLALVLVQKAAAGFKLRWGDKALPWKFVAADIESIGKDAKKISVKGLCEWPILNGVPNQLEKVVLEVRQGYGTVHFQMQTLGLWSVKTVSAGAISTDSKGIKGQLALTSGQKWNATLRRQTEK